MNAARIAVRAIPGKGRGVVALAACGAGEVLEVAPAIELRPADTTAIAATPLDHYYFRHPGDPEGGLLVLGFASLMNHSDNPNAETTAVLDAEAGWQVTLCTLRAVTPGEELTRRYSCAPWFIAV